MNVMAGEKTRVDFNAPSALVEQADKAAGLLDVSRTRLLIESLEEHLEDLTKDDTFRRKLKEAYYDKEVDYDTVESILGKEEAMRMKLLRASLDREPPEPQLEGELPSDEEFYEGDVPKWIPDDNDDDDETEDDETTSLA